MTKDDAIRMAREVGFADDKGVVHAAYQLESFAALVRAAERERREFELAECYRCGWDGGVKAERDACARLCEEEKALRLAEMIQARGEK
jgi:hypothetical protein